MAEIDPSVSKWLKWVVVLLAARTPKPLHWASFLALHPLIRRTVLDPRLHEKLERIGLSDAESETTHRRLLKLSNLISCLLLYGATAENSSIPKDYVLIFLWINYYGKLNPPSAKNIVVSPKYSKYLKIDSYKSATLKKLYENKEFIVYPLIFAQILSNYLTPTKYKLNQRYLSLLIKKHILNPIWINYSLGVNSHYLDWLGLLRSYLFHNFVLFLLVGITSFKDRFLDKYYEIKYGIFNDNSSKSLLTLAKNYVAYVFHKANSFANFIYAPNLISILLISLTSPLLTYLSHPLLLPTSVQRFYANNMKYFFKTYTKVIGFIAAYATIFANDVGFIPDTGYDHKPEETENVRKISKSFLDGLSLYLFRLILLSKWRIAKENHPYFKFMNLASWRKLEAIIMCYGVYKVMNLNDYIHFNNKISTEEAEKLQNDPTIKVVDMVM